LAVKKYSEIEDPHISRSPLYVVFQIMRLTLLTASHVMQQCKKSEYFVMRLTADHSKVRPTPPLICNLRCQSCASHAHVNDLPGDNTAWNALYSSSIHLGAVSSYADQRDVSVTHGANRRATGRSVLQYRAQLTSSALWKNLWHICWPTVTRI